MPQLTAEAWTAWGGALAVAVALLQLALHRRLDLGGLTLATGTVLWIASEGGEALAGWLCAAALVAFNILRVWLVSLVEMEKFKTIR